LNRRFVRAGGFEQVRRMAGLVVLRACADTRSVTAAANSEPSGEPARHRVAQAASRVSPHARARQTGEPLVSCIMPTSDRRRLVGRSIRYFLGQDYPNRELVAIDDGADGVADLITADARIRYVRLPERRDDWGAKRNLGCEQARGELGRR
jgi:hypothetical protein